MSAFIRHIVLFLICSVLLKQGYQHKERMLMITHCLSSAV